MRARAGEISHQLGNHLRERRRPDPPLRIGVAVRDYVPTVDATGQFAEPGDGGLRETALRQGIGPSRLREQLHAQRPTGSRLDRRANLGGSVALRPFERDDVTRGLLLYQQIRRDMAHVPCRDHGETLLQRPQEARQSPGAESLRNQRSPVFHEIDRPQEGGGYCRGLQSLLEQAVHCNPARSAGPVRAYRGERYKSGYVGSPGGACNRRGNSIRQHEQIIASVVLRADNIGATGPPQCLGHRANVRHVGHGDLCAALSPWLAFGGIANDNAHGLPRMQ